MRLATVLTPPTNQYFSWARQVGVTDFVCRYPTHYGLHPIDGLTSMHAAASQSGLRLSVVEGYLPMEPIILGLEHRDEVIAELQAFVRHMGELGISVLCYNFMPRMDWTRTAFDTPGRGGALVSSFDLDQLDEADRLSASPLRTETQWEHLEYFLSRLVPVAEAAGVSLAMHPDDPPLQRVGNQEQIMFEVDSFERLIDLVPSRSNGICFCQGTFAEMGVDIPDTIRRLGTHIRYVHFRDVIGHASNFVETFQDDGQTNMAEAMRTYIDIGFDGPARPDHVPLLEGESGEPGYTMLGRLFAVGYMRGLLDATHDSVVGKNADLAGKRG